MSRGIRTAQLCAAAACAAFSVCASAQAPLASQAVIEHAQATGVLAGLQRAVSTPLEVVWLRTAAEVETWSSAALAGATVGRTGWRYIFGGDAQFAPAPNEVARLVVSSLRLPKAPLTTGTLELAGSGRLFIIAPEAPGRAAPGSVALVLAAGSTLQVADTASPTLQIELKAPAHRALLLGNLASANVRRMLALLVKPDAVNASEASVSGGKVALRSGGEIELAALLDGRAQPTAPQLAAAKPAPLDFAQDFTSLASVFETSSRAPKPAADFSMDFTAIASAVETAAKRPLTMDFARDFTPVVAALESPTPAAVKQAPVVAAAAAAVPAEMDFNRDFANIVAAVEAPVRAPARESPVVVAAVPAAVVREKPVVAIIEASPPPAQTIQQAASIARMRAEIEAEIARDRERLAHQRALAAPAKHFVLGV